MLPTMINTLNSVNHLQKAIQKHGIESGINHQEKAEPKDARSEERRVGKEARLQGDWSSDVCSSDLDDFTVSYHTRTVLKEHMHITEQHIFECCQHASDYDQYIELCKPFAKSDTEAWHREWNKPPGKGRTQRR